MFIPFLPYISLHPCCFQFVAPFGPLQVRKKLNVVLYPFNGTFLAIQRASKSENYTSKELCVQTFLLFLFFFFVRVEKIWLNSSR